MKRILNWAGATRATRATKGDQGDQNCTRGNPDMPGYTAFRSYYTNANLKNATLLKRYLRKKR